MEEKSKKPAGVEEMPIEELRARTREVHRLLRAARDDVRGELASASHASAEACIARLHEMFGRVEGLLPGVLAAGRDADVGEGMGPVSERGITIPSSEEPPDSLTPAEVLRAKQLMQELREGMERMDLLASVERGIDELVGMIEATRQELRQRAEDAATSE